MRLARDLPAEVVLAAGGLVVRMDPDGETTVVVVHRPAYDDWTFPKGKLLEHEELTSCALREVKEETGLRCTLEKLIGFTSYRDRRGRNKIVQYWVMEAVDGEFRPTTEVDEIRWLRVESASRILTYEHDRQLLEAAVGRAT